MSKAGNFEIYVGSPYPVWCTVAYRDKPIAMFTHKELIDLKYAVENAMQEARNVLQEKHKGEV